MENASKWKRGLKTWTNVFLAEQKLSDENCERQKGMFRKMGADLAGLKQEVKTLRVPPLSVGQGGATPAHIEVLHKKIADLDAQFRNCPPSSLSKKNELAIRGLEWRVKETEEISDSHEAIFKVHRGDIAKVEQEIAQVWECLNSDRGRKAPSVLPSLFSPTILTWHLKGVLGPL